MEEILRKINAAYGELQNLLSDNRVQASKLEQELVKVAADRKEIDDRFIDLRNRESAVMVREGKVDALDNLEAIRVATLDAAEAHKKEVEAFVKLGAEARNKQSEENAKLAQRDAAVNAEAARLAAKEKTLEADVRKRVLAAMGVKE